MDGTLAPAIFKPEKNLVFFRIKSRVTTMDKLKTGIRLQLYFTECE